MIRSFVFSLILSLLAFSSVNLIAQDHGNPLGQQQHTSDGHPAHVDSTVAHPEHHSGEATTDHAGAGHAAGAQDPCGHHEEGPFKPGEFAMHHVADANAMHIYGDLYFHLPCILYAPNHGWKFFSSTGKFEPHHHGNGTKAIDGYVLAHGNVMRLQDESLVKGELPVTCIYSEKSKNEKGKEVETMYAMINGTGYPLHKKTSFDGGLMGGGITNFYDYSITRNIFSMLLSCLLLFLGFRSVANSMKKREGLAPKGFQNFMEPLVEFIRDDIAIPNIGKYKYKKFLPYLLTIFFFILGLNLLGQLPFFPGGANVTGSLSVTLILALIAFVVTNMNGNKHYWQHIFAMPGVPKALLPILTPVEILGVFIKPFTLLLRLFANITAGHFVIISFVSLIFIFGKSGESIGGTALGTLISVPLTLFSMALELLVAFLQAYVFTLLTAVYIGSATEEAHH